MSDAKSKPARLGHPTAERVTVDGGQGWEDGFFVEPDRFVTGGDAIAIGDYSETGERHITRTRLRLMGPATARRLADALRRLADAMQPAEEVRRG